MNRIVRTVTNLVLATGFAAAALTVTVAPAHADGEQISLAPHTDPQGPQFADGPDPEPQPLPAPQDPEQPEGTPEDGPGGFTDVPDCTHGCGQDDGGAPDDKQGPNQEPGDEPTDNPAEDAPLDQGCFTGCDLPEEEAPELKGTVAEPTEEIPTPTRIDAGQDSRDDAAHAASRGLTSWLLGGGALAALLAGIVALRSRRNAGSLNA